MNTRTLLAISAMASALPLTMGYAAPTGLVTSPAGDAAQSIPQVLVLSGTKKPEAQVVVSSTRVAPGQPVSVRFVVSNNGHKTMRYSFPTGQQFDVAVEDSKGSEIWRWSQGRTFSGRLTGLTLKPGESATYKAVWPVVNSLNRPVAAGDYALVAQLIPDVRAAITGGIIVNTDTDPDNMGVVTEGAVETGAVRQVPTAAPIESAVKITVAQ